MATITISGQQIEVKKISDFFSSMNDGTKDNGKYEKLITESEEKQKYIQENFSIIRDGFFDVKDLDEAFNVIEA